MAHGEENQRTGGRDHLFFCIFFLSFFIASLQIRSLPATSIFLLFFLLLLTTPSPLTPSSPLTPPSPLPPQIILSSSVPSSSSILSPFLHLSHILGFHPQQPFFFLWVSGTRKISPFWGDKFFYIKGLGASLRRVEMEGRKRVANE